MENREVRIIEGRRYVRIGKIYGRNTKMGGTCYVKYKHIEVGDIRIRRANLSKSGTHWDEEIWATPDATGTLFVLDISNSGKNQSYKILIRNGQITRREPWDPMTEVPQGIRIPAPWEPH